MTGSPTRLCFSPAAVLVLLLAGVAACAAEAPDKPAVDELPDPDPARFSAEIDAFVIWDSKNAPPDEPVLFVGSSSVRLWPTALAFPGQPIVNRGFGGAELSDVIHYYDQVIRPYTAKKIFLYAGDNDIAAGKLADQVFTDYLQLAARVQADFPNTELLFMSIKPSKARWDKWPIMAATNEKIREHAESSPGLGYVDLATPLLGEDGRPMDVFVEDGLHLNERGYLLWRDALLPLLRPPVVEVFACSDNCPGPRSRYMKRVYEGMSDPERCRALGGKPYTIIGWGKRTVCLAE